ncbi:hypothetical protein ACJJTC_014651 [Scirpophaga incertulas]
MLLDRLVSVAKNLEDPNFFLLGPNIKGLYFFGFWQPPIKRMRNNLYNMFLVCTILFVLSQIIDLYYLRHDLAKALDNFSLTALSVVSCAKGWSFVLFKARWYELVKSISQEERTEIQKQNKEALMEMRRYRRYARSMTFSYWLLVLITYLALLLAPLMRYIFSTAYKEGIKEGIEPYPQIINSWFPFDNTKIPGYIYGSAIHLIFSTQGSAAIAMYDTCVVVIIIYLKGELRVLKNQCKRIFETEEKQCTNIFMVNIKECHRKHNVLMRQYTLFNSLVSPIMFFYVLICSITICCSVVQINLTGITTYKKLWVIQYTVGQVFQLFMLCWHANEVFVESYAVDRGVYDSDWWKSNVFIRKHLLLLAGKLNQPFILTAGPFSKLTVLTFISVSIT